MILLDREDVDLIGLTGYWFNHRWEPGDPEAIACDYAEIPSKGPFLLLVNDEAAWVRRDDKDEWRQVARRRRYKCDEQLHWSLLFEMYADAIGVSPDKLRNRYAGLRRRLRKTPGEWRSWPLVYLWPEGSDLVWSSLMNHPWIETRERWNQKELRYVER